MSPPSSPHLEGDVPPELRAIIMECTGDLADVCRLIYASPKALSVFNNYGRHITNAIVRPGKGSEINDMICIVIGLRLSQIGGQSMDDFHQRYVRSIGQTTNDDEFPPGGIESLYPPIPMDLCSAANREIIVTAYRVWWHAQGCLKYYMDRLMALKPSHLVDPTFQYGVNTKRPWHERPEGYHCSVYHTGHPSASEEYVIVRTLWRLQIQHELQNAAIQGRLAWPKQDIDALFPVQADWLWGDDDDDDGDEVMTIILDYLHATEQHWGYDSIPDDDSTHQRRLPRAMYSLPIHWPEQEPIPPERQCSLETLTKYPHPGLQFWELLRRGPRSPLPYVPPQPFRRFGFAIWDLQRFCALGLLSPDERIWNFAASRQGMYFAWRSILADNLLVQIDRVSDERKDKAELMNRYWTQLSYEMALFRGCL